MLHVCFSVFGGCAGCRRRRPRAGRLRFRLGLATEQRGPVAQTPQFRSAAHKRYPDMSTQLQATHQLTLTIDPASVKDRKGNPAALDGPPAWATDNTDVLALEPAVDGMSCLVKAVGPLTAPGSSVLVTATADGAAGAAVRTLIGTAAFEVVAGDAVTMGLLVGPAEEQPDPTPPPAPPPAG